MRDSDIKKTKATSIRMMRRTKENGKTRGKESGKEDGKDMSRGGLEEEKEGTGLRESQGKRRKSITTFYFRTNY